MWRERQLFYERFAYTAFPEIGVGGTTPALRAEPPRRCARNHPGAARGTTPALRAEPPRL
jgi:hypothetical protein